MQRTFTTFGCISAFLALSLCLTANSQTRSPRDDNGRSAQPMPSRQPAQPSKAEQAPRSITRMNEPAPATNRTPRIRPQSTNQPATIQSGSTGHRHWGGQGASIYQNQQQYQSQSPVKEVIIERDRSSKLNFSLFSLQRRDPYFPVSPYAYSPYAYQYGTPGYGGYGVAVYPRIPPVVPVDAHGYPIAGAFPASSAGYPTAVPLPSGYSYQNGTPGYPPAVPIQGAPAGTPGLSQDPALAGGSGPVTIPGYGTYPRMVSSNFQMPQGVQERIDRYNEAIDRYMDTLERFQAEQGERQADWANRIAEAQRDASNSNDPLEAQRRVTDAQLSVARDQRELVRNARNEVTERAKEVRKTFSQLNGIIR